MNRIFNYGNLDDSYFSLVRLQREPLRIATVVSCPLCALNLLWPMYDYVKAESDTMAGCEFCRWAEETGGLKQVESRQLEMEL